jgi:hypothetical protein
VLVGSGPYTVTKHSWGGGQAGLWVRRCGPAWQLSSAQTHMMQTVTAHRCDVSSLSGQPERAAQAFDADGTRLVVVVYHVLLAYERDLMGRLR